MHQELKYSDDMRQHLKRGVDQVANAVKTTLGPGGKLVGVIKEHYSVFTKDGVTVAKAIQLENRYENTGAQALIESAEKANTIGGDGTTVTCILGQSMYGQSVNALDSGVSSVALKQGIKLATDFVSSYLSKIATPIKSYDQIKSVASISANDSEMGTHIANLFSKLGKEGVIVVEESKTIGYEEEYQSGISWDKGMASPYFMTDYLRRRSEVFNPLILLTDKVVDNPDTIYAILSKMNESNEKSLVIIADDISNESLSALVANSRTIFNQKTGKPGQFHVLAIRAPYATTSQLDALEDMACKLGATVISAKKGMDLPTKPEQVDLKLFGRSDKVISDPVSTVIIGGKGKDKDVKKRTARLKADLRLETRDWEKTKIKERLARLHGLVAILRFGAENESITKEKKYRIEDSINATRNALDEGIVLGGEVAILKASLVLNLKANGDEARGVEIVRQALQEPIKVLAHNAGESGNGVLKRVIEGQKNSKNFGWDAAKYEYGDMIEKGILDPVKVVKSAVQNASATCCLLLDTEAIITDITEAKPLPPPRPGM